MNKSRTRRAKILAKARRVCYTYNVRPLTAKKHGTFGIFEASHKKKVQGQALS